jgi:hypothetical protein
MTGRSAVREFADLLDASPTVGTSDPDPELQALLRAAEALTVLGAVLSEPTALPDDVRARQRARLVAVAHVRAQQADGLVDRAGEAAAVHGTGREAAAPSAVRWDRVRWDRVRWEQRRRRWTIGLAGVCAMTVGFTGVGVAADRSLPGMPFYGVKRGTEAVQLALPRSDVSEGNLRLGIAKTRLREVEGLVSDDDHLASRRITVAGGGSGVVALSATSKQELIRQTLEDMDEETRRGTALLTKVARSNQDAEPLWQLWTFADAQQKRLQTILPALPSEQQTFATSSITVVADVKVQMQTILVTEFHATLPPAVTNPAPPTTPSPAPGTGGGSGGTGGTGGGSTPSPATTPSPSPTPSDPPSIEPTPPPASPSEEPPPAEEPTPSDPPVETPPAEPTDEPTAPDENPLVDPLVDPLASLIATVPSLLDQLLDNPSPSP